MTIALQSTNNCRIAALANAISQRGFRPRGLLVTAEQLSAPPAPSSGGSAKAFAAYAACKSAWADLLASLLHIRESLGDAGAGAGGARGAAVPCECCCETRAALTMATPP